MTTRVVSALLLLASLLLLPLSSSAQVSVADSTALVEFYRATNGVAWKNNTNWLTANPVSDWHGVTVENGRVTGLNLSSNQLEGTLPASFWTLDALRTIYLGSNEIVATIPAAIGQFDSLEVLSIGSNDITGTIPKEIGSCANLRRIEVGGTEIGGTIPEELFDCRKMRVINLQSTDIEGRVSSKLADLVELEIFDVSTTGLTGTLPSLEKLVNLNSLHIRDSKIGGHLDSLFPVRMPNLYYFTMRGNEIGGELKAERFNPDALVFVTVENCRITGVDDFTSFPKLRRLQVAGNRLTFADLIPNRSIEQFSYADQAPLLEPETRTVKEGESLRISSGIADPMASYTWYKDGQMVQGQTDSLLVIASVTPSDAGTYTAEMKRPELPDLTLERSRVTVSVDGSSSVNGGDGPVSVATSVDHIDRTIAVEALRSATYRCVDPLGRTRAIGSLDAGGRVEILGEERGLYLLVIESEGDVQIEKILL